MKHSLKNKPGRKLTEADKEKLRQNYKNNKPKGFGGYQENAGRGKRYLVIDSFGKKVTLQSSYEKELQEIVDKNQIKWIRPSSLRYDVSRNYFPDFFLVDFDIFIDTKMTILPK